MRVVFLGTPDFAVPVLTAVAQSRHELVAVVSQPDRARNRKNELLPTPVHAAADQLGLPCYLFERIRDHVAELRALRPDIMVTAAYGQILTQEVLDVPAHGVINVHASLLPKYRGSSPIQWAVINGETETGVTIMKTERGLDCGEILRFAKTPIGDKETAGDLFERLQWLGARLAVEELDAIEAGTSSGQKQDDAAATFCGKLTKADGELNFNRPARVLHNRIRGLNPWPIAYTFWNGEQLKVYASSVTDCKGMPGEVIVSDGRKLLVACADGALSLESVQLPGKRVVTAAEFLAGHKIQAGTVLGR